MAKLQSELTATVAKYLVSNYKDYSITVTNHLHLIELKYNYNGVNGEIRFKSQHELFKINQNIMFINDFNNKRLQPYQKFYLTDHSTLFWTGSTLRLEMSVLTFELPQELVPIIVKIASYVNIKELTTSNFLSIGAIIEQYLANLEAMLVDGKFKD